MPICKYHVFNIINEWVTEEHRGTNCLIEMLAASPNPNRCFKKYNKKAQHRSWNTAKCDML